MKKGAGCVGTEAAEKIGIGDAVTCDRGEVIAGDVRDALMPDALPGVGGADPRSALIIDGLAGGMLNEGGLTPGMSAKSQHLFRKSCQE